MSPSQLTLNLAEGSITFRFTLEAARGLRDRLGQLTATLKANAVKTTGTAGRPTPQKPMEYQYTGDVFLEIYCNPNIYASPFAAKVLITLRDDRIRVSTEAELTRTIEDIDRYLEQAS